MIDYCVASYRKRCRVQCAGANMHNIRPSKYLAKNEWLI